MARAVAVEVVQRAWEGEGVGGGCGVGGVEWRACVVRMVIGGVTFAASPTRCNPEDLGWWWWQRWWRRTEGLEWAVAGGARAAGGNGGGGRSVAVLALVAGAHTIPEAILGNLSSAWRHTGILQVELGGKEPHWQ